MAPPKLPHKKDTVSSDAFLRISAEAKAKVCHAAIGLPGGERFCYEVASSEWAGFAFQSHRGLGYSDQPSLASSSLSQGKLGLARLLFARAKSATPLSKRSWETPLGRMLPLDAMARLYAGEAGDGQAWRARRWILSALRDGPATAADLEAEASLAFSLGRPAAGANLLILLAKMPPEEIASCRLGPDTFLEIPEMRSPLKIELGDEADHVCRPRDWEKALAQVMIKDGWRGELRKMLPKDLTGRPALALAGMWSGILRASSRPQAPALASLLDEACEELWALGAPSSPSDYARRFASKPLAADALQIQAISKYSALEQTRRLLPLWHQAAATPKAPCGRGILWDAFVEAHQGLAAAPQSDPFALRDAGQTAAMWSLAWGPDLIELGLERGFDPKPTSRLLAKPGVLGKAAQDKVHLAPRSDAVHSSHPDQSGCGVAGLHCPGRMRGAPKKAGSDSKGWLHTNLATLALAAGHQPTALALMRAGCEIPDPELPLAELSEQGGRSRQQIDELRTRWEAFCLRASLEADPKPKGRKAAQAAAPAPEPAAPKRRILKA